MIDLKQLRENPDRFREGCTKKNMHVDIDRLLSLDARRRTLVAEQESLRAEQKRLEKELGPHMGKLSGELKKADPARKDALQRELDELKAKPTSLKVRIQSLEEQAVLIEPELTAILLTVPLPPDADVPVGTTAEDNVELKRWSPNKSFAGPTAGFDPSIPYEQNRGFRSKSHLELVKDLGLADFDRGVRMAGTRSYVLTGDGMLLHNAILRYAFDFMTLKHGFKAVSVPVIVREECMVGTGFFPGGREQAYLVDETHRNNPDAAGTGPASPSAPAASGAAQHQSGGSRDLFLTGTGEVGLMGLHQGEILREEDLPLRYTTVSTCFRREAGAAGKDTAGLYRIHQFDKVEQVVICKASESDSRAWHKIMIGYVEELLQSLGLPYRLLQCCTGDLGVKNADMIDVECWMPGRGQAIQSDGNTTYTGAYGETHSASRLYDFQCRRLNMRYRAGGEQGQGPTTICHSLNNTVAASPRILIPILEMYQNTDGSVTVPEVLRQHMGGKATITRA